MKEILSQLAPVIMIVLAIVVAALWAIIKSPTRPLIKALAIPATLVATIVVCTLFAGWLGRSVPLPLPDPANVLAHRIIVQDHKKTKIEIWVKQNPTRLYVVPWTKQLEDALGGAADARDQGFETILRLKKKQGAPGGQQRPQGADEYETEKAMPQELMPKQGVVTPLQEQMDEARRKKDELIEREQKRLDDLLQQQQQEEQRRRSQGQ